MGQPRYVRTQSTEQHSTCSCNSPFLCFIEDYFDLAYFTLLCITSLSTIFSISVSLSSYSLNIEFRYLGFLSSSIFIILLLITLSITIYYFYFISSHYQYKHFYCFLKIWDVLPLLPEWTKPGSGLRDVIPPGIDQVDERGTYALAVQKS